MKTLDDTPESYINVQERKEDSDRHRKVSTKMDFVGIWEKARSLPDK